VVYRIETRFSTKCFGFYQLFYKFWCIRSGCRINKCPAMKDSAKIPILEGFTCPRCGQELLFKDDLTQGGCVYCSIGKQNNHFERLKND